MKRWTGMSMLPALVLVVAGCVHQPAVPEVVPSVEVPAAEAADVQPAATLQLDEFDAPAAISVAEARKAASGGGGHEEPAAPPPDPHAGHEHAKGATEQQTVYVCPMHPEVTSATPGNCPKCGMALVKAAPKKEK